MNQKVYFGRLVIALIMTLVFFCFGFTKPGECRMGSRLRAMPC